MSWRKVAVLATTLFIVGSMHCFPNRDALAGMALTDDIDWNGYLEESYARRIGEHDDVIYHRQTLNSEVSGELADWADFRFQANLRHNNPEFERGGDVDVLLREAYLRIRHDNFDLRLGRIQIAWGEADGLIISDQVSPFELINFIVPSFDSIRLGVDGASFDYYFEDGSDLQLLWIAAFEEPDYPTASSPWSFFDPETLQANGIELGATQRPARSFDNSEFGVRYSRHPRWADWSVGYLRSVDDRPAPRLIGTGQRPDTFAPTHDFFDLFTFNLAAPVSEFLLRIDSAYESGRYLGVDTTNPAALATAANDFVSEEDLWRTLLGVDFKPDVPYWEQADASLQYIHEEVISPDAPLAQATQADLLSVTLRASYRNDTIKPFLFWIVDLRGSSSWMQARADYEPWDNWRFSLEYDLFQGHAYNPQTNSGGIYGSFAENELVQATIRRSF